MAPKSHITEKETEIYDPTPPEKPTERVYEYVWPNIIWFIALHIMTFMGMWRFFTLQAQWQTMLFAYLLYVFSGLGITAGSHRLWSHRAYKAKGPLRVFLMICNTIAWQDSIIHWSRDHRNHHKYTDTDADPYNSKRGLFYSHIGWLMTKKHPDVITVGRKLDISDLTSDPVAMFQHNYYTILYPTFCFILPTIIPMMAWGETFANAFLIAGIFRYAFVLHITWTVNSFAHVWGDKPYDKGITPAQMPGLAVFAMGEGWHNFHHAFPNDYKSDEYGGYKLNFSTFFIDTMVKLGWAYDAKAVEPEIVAMRKYRTGEWAQSPDRQRY